MKPVVRVPARGPTVASREARLESRLERWEERTGEILPEDLFEVLVHTLGHLGDPVLESMLGASSNVAQLIRRVANLGGVPGRSTLAGRALDVLEDLASENDNVRGPGVWHSDHVCARLEAAARTHSTLQLDLGARTCTLAISKIVRRGTTQFVLGEDEDDTSHAVPIDTIRAVAEATHVGPPAKWTPLPGTRPPSGHLPCPCGSGARYRDCCRAAPEPS